jgi:hypothetical protein
MATVTMTAVTEQVHQRTSEHDQEWSALQQMRAVAQHEPSHGCRQAEPKRPLI